MIEIPFWNDFYSIISPENKEEIIQLAFANHVPLDKTWSCYSGNSKPCGKCDSCRIRNAAYEKWLNNNNKK